MACGRSWHLLPWHSKSSLHHVISEAVDASEDTSMLPWRGEETVRCIIWLQEECCLIGRHILDSLTYAWQKQMVLLLCLLACGGGIALTLSIASFASASRRWQFGIGWTQKDYSAGKAIMEACDVPSDRRFSVPLQHCVEQDGDWNPGRLNCCCNRWGKWSLHNKMSDMITATVSWATWKERNARIILGVDAESKEELRTATKIILVGGARRKTTTSFPSNCLFQSFQLNSWTILCGSQSFLLLMSIKPHPQSNCTLRNLTGARISYLFQFPAPKLFIAHQSWSYILHDVASTKFDMLMVTVI